MNFKKYLILALPGLLLSLGLLTVGEVQASDDTAVDLPVVPALQPGELYLPSDDPMADLSAKLDAARESDRLLLVVMGGNWCHDSRALASRLFEQPLSDTIEAHYEMLFVDVGYLEKGKEVITSLGIPVYYATPTVLIVDPVSGRVVNAQNRHQWGNAANIGMAESLEYFRQFADTGPSLLQDEDGIDEQLKELLTDIDVFEQEQADRLYKAYAVLAPMLRAYKEGARDAFSEELWNEVRDFRYRVAVDVDGLRAEARKRVAAEETGISLDFPLYPAFSWESK